LTRLQREGKRNLASGPELSVGRRDRRGTKTSAPLPASGVDAARTVPAQPPSAASGPASERTPASVPAPPLPAPPPVPGEPAAPPAPALPAPPLEPPPPETPALPLTPASPLDPADVPPEPALPPAPTTGSSSPHAPRSASANPKEMFRQRKVNKLMPPSIGLENEATSTVAHPT